MNEILLIYTAIGPTFRDRMVHHIENFEAFKYFDVLILTDYVHHESFEKLTAHTNVTIKDIQSYRNKYPEFFDYEKIPNEKKSETIYKNEIKELQSQGFTYPLHLQRFGLSYENIEKYKYVAMCDVDVAVYHTTETFSILHDYLVNHMENDSVSSNKAYYEWQTNSSAVTYLQKWSSELNKPIRAGEVISSFDNPFKVFKFSKNTSAENLLRTWNYCLLETFKHDVKELIPGSWNMTSELLLAMVYKLENLSVNVGQLDYVSVGEFKTLTYPEDRFWDNVLLNDEIDCNVDTKMEFVRKNFQFLKNFYTERQQDFNYE